MFLRKLTQALDLLNNVHFKRAGVETEGISIDRGMVAVKLGFNTGMRCGWG